MKERRISAPSSCTEGIRVAPVHRAAFAAVSGRYRVVFHDYISFLTLMVTVSRRVEKGCQRRVFCFFWRGKCLPDVDDLSGEGEEKEEDKMKMKSGKSMTPWIRKRKGKKKKVKDINRQWERRERRGKNEDKKRKMNGRVKNKKRIEKKRRRI